MKLDQLLQEAASEAVKSLYGTTVQPETFQVQETRKEFSGERTLVVFPLLRFSKKKPEITAAEIGDYLEKKVDLITGFEVVQGFLNLTIKPAFWLNWLSSNKGEAVEIEKNSSPQRIMVEYSSPNSNKPLHLGHIRNNLLGYSISEILKTRGHEVIKANLINDRGINVSKSMVAYLRYGEGKTPKSEGVKGDHFVGEYYVRYNKEFEKEVETLIHQGNTPEVAKKNASILKEAQEILVKWEQGDEKVRKLWEEMNSWVYEGFDETYNRMGVDFDKYYYESDTYLLGKELVNEGLEKGIFYKKENNSVWIDLTPDGLDEKLLLRGDGTAVYMTQDMGTAELKQKEYSLDQSMYIVGNEQDYHFKVLKLVMQKLGRQYADGIFHLSYGMVDLPEGKMKSREGTVVDADDLMNEMEETARQYSTDSGKIEDLSREEKDELFRKLGLGALKFFILKTDPKKRMLFNPKESIDFQGHTGPFVQYTHARIRSVLRKAGEKYDVRSLTIKEDVELQPEEMDLILLLYRFNEVVAEAEKGFSPALVANFIYDLAKSFNKFYHEHSILKEEDEEKLKLRIVLSSTVGETLHKASSLLGIEVPERM